MQYTNLSRCIKQMPLLLHHLPRTLRGRHLVPNAVNVLTGPSPCVEPPRPQFLGSERTDSSGTRSENSSTQPTTRRHFCVTYTSRKPANMVKKTKEPVSDNQLVAAMEPVRQFALDSYRLVKRCTKPDMKGAAFVTVCSSYAVGNDTIFPALTLSACFLCAFSGQSSRRSLWQRQWASW